MTKLVGSWHIPDDEDFKLVIESAHRGIFTCYEPIVVALEYIDKFDFAIDVGTWIGDSTDIISRMFSKVHGFEANPTVFECTVKNLKNRNNITLSNFALSNTDGTKELFNGDASFSGWINTLDHDAPEELRSFKKTSVDCQTLDYYKFVNVDFIKIDIDSHEGYFLEGAVEFFQTNNPVILIEHKPKVLIRQNKDMPDALKFLQNIGYHIVAQPSRIDYILKRKL